MKYPYISTKSNNLLFYAKDTATLIGDESNSFSHGFKITVDESGFENNTREYLANTYGEVQSPEHAAFIIELAELHGFKVWSPSDGLKRITHFACFHGELNMHSHSCDGIVIAARLKQITIPLPPKAEPKIYPQEKLGEAPKHFDCVCNKCGGRCCTGQCYKQESSEWPQVGDEAIHPTHGLCNVVSPVDCLGIVTVINEQRINTLVFKSDLSKPKTPEEELRDDLKFDIAFLSFTYEKPRIITEKLLEKYDIKKKPQ
jgi:hypothetical protein